MKKLFLEDCCEILDSMRIPITASERKSGPYPYYGANGIQDYVADYIFDDELVLLAEDGGNFGSKTRPIAYRVSGKCWVNNHAHVLKPKEDFNVDYLCYSLMFYNTDGLVNGATRQKLTQATMRQMLIPQRTYQEQCDIVTQLNKTNLIIETRQQQLQKLDELVKARFVELFGSPCINSKGFQTQKGSSLFKISNGRAVPNDRRFETGIPAYGGNGISWYTDDILCKNDTIVIGRVGFQSGNVHLVKGPVWITDNAMYISELYDDNLSLVFLCAMMEHIDFTKQQDAGDLKKVTQKPFMETEYILPPKSLQEKYISFVEQVDKSKLSPYRDCWTRCNFCLAVWCDNTSNKEDIMEWLMNLDPSIWAALIGAVGAIIVALIKVIIPLFKKKEKASDKVAPSINQTVTGNGNTVIGIQNNMKGEKDGQ